MTSFDVVAQRSRRDSGHLYVFAVPLARIGDVIPVPVVGQRAEGNRLLDVRHAREFGAYWTRSARWAVPPLLLDTPEELDRWFEIAMTAGGLAAGVLRLPGPEISRLQILDGQHRVYGWAEVRATLVARTAVLHERLERALGVGDERSVGEAQRGLAEIAKSEQRLNAEQVTVEVLDGVDSAEHKQWFFDIAANAKGITKSLTASFDQTSAMNRAAVRLADDYPYLDTMVEREAERVGARTEQLVSMAQLVSIVEAAVLGIDGAVRADAIAALDADSAYEIGASTLDALFDGFDALRAVADGDEGANAVRLRENSLLGSVTVLRILAGVVNRAAVSVRDGKFEFDDDAADRVTDFFKSIADDMDGELPDALWASGAFETRLGRAPRARRQEVKALFNALWAMWLGYVDGASRSLGHTVPADGRHAVQDALDFDVETVPEPSESSGSARPGGIAEGPAGSSVAPADADVPSESDVPSAAQGEFDDDDDDEAEPDLDLEVDEAEDLGNDTEGSSEIGGDDRDGDDKAGDRSAGDADVNRAREDIDDGAPPNVDVEPKSTTGEEYVLAGSDESDLPQQRVRTRGATTDPVKDYLTQIGKTALLNAEQEIDLAKRIEAGLFAAERLSQNYGQGWDKTKASADQRRLYRDLQWIVNDGKRAKAQLLGANLRLVVSLAKRYTGRGMLFLDLIQEGNIGLIRAVERFDYSKGFKFSTYATWWIRQAITRAMADQGRTIRLPVHVVEKIGVIRKAQRDLVAKYGDAKLDAIAHATDIPVVDVDRYLAADRPVLSLDVLVAADPEDPRGEWDGYCRVVPFGETLAAEKDDIDELVDRMLLRAQVDRALNMLATREYGIITRRFGLHDGEQWTLDAIGQVYGVTRERIRQLEKLTIDQLQSTMRDLAQGHSDVGVPPQATNAKGARKRAAPSPSERHHGTGSPQSRPKKSGLPEATAGLAAKKAATSRPAATARRAVSTPGPTPALGLRALGGSQPVGDRHGAPWSRAEDDQVRDEHRSGLSVAAIARLHGRSETAIRYRFGSLGLAEHAGEGSGSKSFATLEEPPSAGAGRRGAGVSTGFLSRPDRTPPIGSGQMPVPAPAARPISGDTSLDAPALADLVALAGHGKLIDADALRTAFEAGNLAVIDRKQVMQALWSCGYRIGKFDEETDRNEPTIVADSRPSSTPRLDADVGDDSPASIASKPEPSSPTAPEVPVRGTTPTATAPSTPPALATHLPPLPRDGEWLPDGVFMPSTVAAHVARTAQPTATTQPEMLPSIPPARPVPERGRHVAAAEQRETPDARPRGLRGWLRRAAGLD